MSNSVFLKDYIAQGLAAARPSAPLVATSVTAFYYATDTTTLSFYDWNAASWVTVGGGGGGGAVTQLGDVTTSGSQSTITFSSLGSCNHLELVWQGRGDASANETGLALQFNADGGANYDSNEENRFGTVQSFAQSSAAIGQLIAASGASNYNSTGRLLIPNYASTEFYKSYQSTTGNQYGTSGGNIYQEIYNGTWRSTAAITSVTLVLGSGSFEDGSRFTLYGLT